MAKEGKRLKFRAKNRIVEAVLLEKESFLTGQAKKGAYLLAFTQRKKGQSFEMILLHPGNKELRNTSMSSVAGAEVRTIFLQPPSAVEIVEDDDVEVRGDFLLRLLYFFLCGGRNREDKEARGCCYHYCCCCCFFPIIFFCLLLWPRLYPLTSYSSFDDDRGCCRG